MSGIFTESDYTDENERYHWWLLRGVIKNEKIRHKLYGTPLINSKNEFRARRGWNRSCIARRIGFGNSDEIGTFVKMTSRYLLVSDSEESQNFCRTVKGDLCSNIPVISTSLAGCGVIGCMCVGNKYGLLVPDTIYDTELHTIKEELPDSVEVTKVEERLSALGNVIACNDNVAIVHPDLDKETEEIIANTLQVEVFRCTIADNPLVGSYSVLNNNGGLVCKNIRSVDLENLSSLLQLPLVPGSVNKGNNGVASGLFMNDSFAYAGLKTTITELKIIEEIFRNTT